MSELFNDSPDWAIGLAVIVFVAAPFLLQCVRMIIDHRKATVLSASLRSVTKELHGVGTAVTGLAQRVEKGIALSRQSIEGLQRDIEHMRRDLR